jgi:hypothetical protein
LDNYGNKSKGVDQGSMGSAHAYWPTVHECGELEIWLSQGYRVHAPWLELESIQAKSSIGIKLGGI